MRAHALNLAIGLSGLVALGVAATIVPNGSRSRYTRFVAAPLPQHAIGDFDGDGQPDVANISARSSGGQGILIALSGSAGDIRLDASVSALIEGDFDHDGDLDLLATTPSGEVLIWVNDGHGRFTRQEPSQRRTIAGEPAWASASDPSFTMVAADSWVLEAPIRAHRAVVALAIRPPTSIHVDSRDRQLVPALRAPPDAVL
jgi:hypothetical protein